MLRIVGLGGALLLLGSIADWSGVEYSSRLDRSLALAAGGFALMAVVLAVRVHARLLALALVAALVGLNMAIVNIVDIAGQRYEYASYPEAAVGVGLYAVLAGSVLVLAGVAAAFRPSRRVG